MDMRRGQSGKGEAEEARAGAEFEDGCLLLLVEQEFGGRGASGAAGSGVRGDEKKKM